MDKPQASDQVLPGYERDPKGVIRKVGQDPKAMSWRDRAIKAEHFVVSLVEERKVLQRLLLDAYTDITARNFTCSLGPLNEYRMFRNIACIARGQPELFMPPLEQMPLDGMRAVRKMTKNADTGEETVWMECGHTLIMPKSTPEVSAFPVKCGQMVACQTCINELKTYGLFKIPQAVNERSEA